MKDRNTFLAILLCLGILIGWQAIGPKLFPDAFPPPPGATDGGTGFPDGGVAAGTQALANAPRDAGPAGVDGGVSAKAQGTSATGTKGTNAPEPGAGEGGTDAGHEAHAGPPDRPEERVVIENEVVRATLSTKGGTIARWELLDPRFAHAGADGKQPVNLVAVDEKEALPFATTFEGLGWPADASYEVAERSDRSVTFRASAGGVTVEKRFELDPKEPYQLSLKISLQGPVPKAVVPSIRLARITPEQQKRSGGLSFLMRTMPDIVRPTCAYGDEIERRRYDEDETSFAHSGDLHWVGIDSRYFLMAVYPAQGTRGGCRLEVPEKHRLRATFELPPLSAGESQTVEGYLGPKFKTQLSAYGHELQRSIDFGWFGLLSIFLLYVMTFFDGVAGNWGVAIILLTVTVKTVLLPLTNWSMRSMERMRAISPKMKALKEKYGKDQQRFQQEMMKLYREEGVSPFGGCLPMLLQFPIWIALYRTILNTAELYHAGFISGWLEDLSAPEPGLVKILPLLMGVTMFVMQKMQPTPTAADDTQAKMQKTMMYFMPPFFTFIMYGLPSGLTLYIFVNNLLSIGQQQIIRKRLGTDQVDDGAGVGQVKTGKARKARKKVDGKA
ncbi:MAG: membrane protein insertase YidC [Deltaproteobacteria bacterium]|nr:MAG: membrane protein insertase YidC [Deltaproteobacteria bacterium]